MMKPTIVLAALLSLHCARAQVNATQIPLDDDAILNNSPNATIAVSSDTDSPIDTASFNADNTAKLTFGPALLAASHAPSGSSIESLHWAGTACPDPTSLFAKQSPGSSALSLFTPRFVLMRAVPHAQPADSRRQCTVSLKLSYPSGWTFSLGGAESQGYVGFEAGGGAVVEGRYWIVGERGSESWSSRLEPPRHEEWMLGYKPNDEKSGRWASCVGERSGHSSGDEGGYAEEGDQTAALSVQMSVYLAPAASDPGVVLLEWTNLYLRWRECDSSDEAEGAAGEEDEESA